MGYQRAKWHSGLTYRQTCEQCKTVVEYQDDKLGYRPWFPDGFVYCPTCQKPLRHHEDYALGAHTPKPVPATTYTSGEAFADAFCTQCGHAFGPNDRFCAKCGNKRN